MRDEALRIQIVELLRMLKGAERMSGDLEKALNGVRNSLKDYLNNDTVKNT